MHRICTPDSPRLEALLDQRDHLKIQISLFTDAVTTDQARLKALKLELKMLEKRIEQFGREVPPGTAPKQRQRRRPE